MADTITIGTTTYHKLVTFKDCASTGNGGGGMFPWAFVKYDKTKDLGENEKVLSFNPKYFSENTESKYISFDELENTPLDATGSYITGHTVGGKIYEKLVCEKDLNNTITTDKNPKITGNVFNNSDLYIAQKFYISLGDESGQTAIFSWESPKLKENKSFSSNTRLPSPTSAKSSGDSSFVFGIRHSGTDNKYFKVEIEPSDSKSNIFFGLYGERIGEKSEYNNYTHGYNGGPLNYRLFWNICKLAELNMTPIYFGVSMYD